jgi:hypothetical protein
VGSILVCAKEIRQRKKSTSRQTYCQEEKLEKDKDKGVKMETTAVMSKKDLETSLEEIAGVVKDATLNNEIAVPQEYRKHLGLMLRDVKEYHAKLIEATAADGGLAEKIPSWRIMLYLDAVYRKGTGISENELKVYEIKAGMPENQDILFEKTFF